MEFDPAYDYSKSDLTRGDNLTCWKFGELVKTLLTLSSRADRQIEIMGIGHVADEMAADFETYYALSFRQYLDRGLINEYINEKLSQLDDYLGQRSGGLKPDFWDDRTLPTDEDWENVRTQAKGILTALGYEDLEIELDREEKYEMTQEGQKFLIQTTRTRLVDRKGR
jgi:hypothetical protein